MRPDKNKITKLLLSNNNDDRKLGFTIISGYIGGIGDWPIERVDRYLFEYQYSIRLFDPKLAGLVAQSNNKYIAAIGYIDKDNSPAYLYIER